MSYEGETNERGESHGQGIYFYADGDRYEGQWKDGERHGRGFVETLGGVRTTELWRNGKLVSSEGIESMSRDDLTLELLKLRERISQLRISTEDETSKSK